ncbi:MAG TPA: hypothetical protein VKT82_31580 [Ktedonobacterales bacterium]|nr:hypothetical protein [Ktedonobacterales bacterium]
MPQPGRDTARAGADWRAADVATPTPLVGCTAQANGAGRVQALAEPSVT